MIFVLTCVWSRVYYRVPDSALKLVEGLFMETEVRYEIFNFFFWWIFSDYSTIVCWFAVEY